MRTTLLAAWLAVSMASCIVDANPKSFEGLLCTPEVGCPGELSCIEGRCRSAIDGDGGTTTPDAGPVDGGTLDGGSSDGGPSDAGPPDGGPIGPPPIAGNVVYVTKLEETLNVPAPGVLLGATGADGGTLVAVLATSTSHGALELRANGALTYTPNPGFSGRDAFTFRVTDTVSTSEISRGFVVVSAAPITFPDVYVTPSQETLSVNASAGVLANDDDPEGSPLRAEKRIAPRRGVLQLAESGSFVFTPPSGGLVGLEHFTYLASDENFSIEGIVLLLGTELEAGRALERMGTDNAQGEPDGPSSGKSLSGDGRFVAFASVAANLVPEDANGLTDVFVTDRLTNTTERVSRGRDQLELVDSDGPSRVPSISADGVRIAFESQATNLVPNKATTGRQIYYHDRQSGLTEIVSVTAGGTLGNGPSSSPSISADGRYVAFRTDATNLVPIDLNAAADIVVVELETGGVTRASLSNTGVEANGASDQPSISADGRWVAFSSTATNLVSGDTNGVADIFVRDRLSGRTVRVSVGAGGAEANGTSFLPVISASGRFVAFTSQATNLVPGDTNGKWDVFVHDRIERTTFRVSVDSAGRQAEGAVEFLSDSPAISADGRRVAFRSVANNLVPGDPEGADIYVHDLVAGWTVKVDDVSEAQGQSSAPAISLDGRYVGFESAAQNLVVGDTNSVTDVLVAPVAVPRQPVRVSLTDTGGEVNRGCTEPVLSADGSRVAFSSSGPVVGSDTNEAGDVHVVDLPSRTVRRVSVSSQGQQGDAASARSALSGDGRFVAFQSLATNLVAGDVNSAADVFVHDLRTSRTECVSVSADGVPRGGIHPAISFHGRFVAFVSNSGLLVRNDSNGFADIFVHDRYLGETRRVSISSAGEESNFGAGAPSISADGRFVAFTSLSSNLVEGDTNSASDIFVHDLQLRQTSRASVSTQGVEANGASDAATISADGRFVLFQSSASNLVAGDTNEVRDVFVHDRQTGTTTRVSQGADGSQGDGLSELGTDRSGNWISGDGRFAMFSSLASNLVVGDANQQRDAFVRDLASASIERVSVGAKGVEASAAGAGHAISIDGRVAVFASDDSTLVPGDNNSQTDLFVVFNPGAH